MRAVDHFTLSIHDALPISRPPAACPDARERSARGRAACRSGAGSPRRCATARAPARTRPAGTRARSEEHTSELQSLTNLVCRLLLKKKNDNKLKNNTE